MDEALGARVPLGILPTPLQRLETPAGLLVKRDDLSGFGLAGNKTRPLEYLLGYALRHGQKRVVTGGLPTSNFIAALAQAACGHGLQCHVLVPRPVTETPTVAFARLVGATVEEVDIPREALDEAIAERARDLTRAGHAAFGIPRGGANRVGALGFARAAFELQSQLPSDEVTIVIPVGSGASLAGLLAGTVLTAARWRIVAVSVSRPVEQAHHTVRALANEVLADQGVAADSLPDVSLVDRLEHVPTACARDTLRQLACQGIVVDGHYGLPTWLVAAELAAGGAPTVYWHTGGMASVPDLLRELTP